MSVAYNGQAATATWGERIRSFITGRKEALPMTPYNSNYWNVWTDATWAEATWQNLVTTAYKQNVTVFACTQALAQGFAEAPLAVYDTKTKEQLESHPILGLIHNPNPLMSERELWMYVMTYEPLGGDSFLVKMRSGAKIVKELWPYSRGMIKAVPAQGNAPASWIDHFDYDLGTGAFKRLEVRDVIHTKWMPDPEYYWRGTGAVEVCFRDVQTSNELTRMVKALLQNDAVPRSALHVPEAMPEHDIKNLKDEWRLRHGHDNRGGLAVFQYGAKLERIALDLQELAVEELSYMPEAHICEAFKVPPIVAHTYVGLSKGTYSNYREARQQFTEETLRPKWAAWASELNQSLVPEFDPRGTVYVDFDMSKVGALKEDLNAKAVWVVAAWDKGLITRNHSLTLLGEQPLDGPEGDEYKTASAAPAAAQAPGQPPPAGDAGMMGDMPDMMPAMPAQNGNGKGKGKQPGMQM